MAGRPEGYVRLSEAVTVPCSSMGTKPQHSPTHEYVIVA